MEINNVQDKKQATFIFDAERNQYVCQGFWSVLCLNHLIETLNTFMAPRVGPAIINGEQIQQLDSAGALALIAYKNKLRAFNKTIELVHFTEPQLKLIELLENKNEYLEYVPTPPQKEKALIKLGKETIYKITQIDGLIILVGNLTDKLFRAAINWRHFQLPSIISNINSTGIQALPILALLSFLIGVVLAYQMGLQLETYGATTFIAYLCGMASFREFGPLITAIIVAGRTSSAFTAQIGSMKLNEEVDALETMGLSPVELLVLPKMIALLIVFPLLIFWADAFSIMGAMFMSKFKLDIENLDFLIRLRNSVGAKQMFLGIYKAPVFAIVIALVGCFQGFNVESNASSIGSQTTRSVVQSLFLIIIVDAVFSIIYSWLQL